EIVRSLRRLEFLSVRGVTSPDEPQSRRSLACVSGRSLPRWKCGGMTGCGRRGPTRGRGCRPEAPARGVPLRPLGQGGPLRGAPVMASLRALAPPTWSLGPDENGRHRFNFSVQFEYVTAVAPNAIRAS